MLIGFGKDSGWVRSAIMTTIQGSLTDVDSLSERMLFGDDFEVMIEIGCRRDEVE